MSRNKLKTRLYYMETIDLKLNIKTFAENKVSSAISSSLRDAKTEKEQMEWFEHLLKNKGEFMTNGKDDDGKFITNCIEYQYKPLKVIPFQFKDSNDTIPNLIVYEVIKYKDNSSEGIYRLMPTRKNKSGGIGKVPRLLKNAINEAEFRQIEKLLDGKGFKSFKRIEAEEVKKVVETVKEEDKEEIKTIKEAIKKESK